MPEDSLYPANPVLLVDDERSFLDACEIVLKSAGINHLVKMTDSREVMPWLAASDASVIVLDLTMPHVQGGQLQRMIADTHPGIPVIILTGDADIGKAVALMKNGAVDYIVKPSEPMRFVSAVRRAIESREMAQQNLSLKRSLLTEALQNPAAFSSIITNSRKMKAVFQYIESVAATNLPILITGETGAGKELVARAIHDLSGRKGAFVPVNAGGLDDTLFNDTLFGHKKGAFSGALQQRKGLIETAANGTVFLDEIGDLELQSQVKLLRLLQQREYYPLGADAPLISNARVIMATNHDLKRLVAQGKFRQDLYYRIYAHQIDIPPLRDRLDDLPLLLGHFLEEAAESLGKKAPTAPKELLTLLSNYHFPGNIRELQSMTYNAVSRHTKGVLSMSVFYEMMGPDISPAGENDKAKTAGAGNSALRVDENSGVFPTLKEAESFLINEALIRAGGNARIAAHMLGLTHAALQKRIDRSTKQ